MDWNFPDDNGYGGFDQPSRRRRLGPLVIVAVVFLIGGLCLGWLVFGRGNDAATGSKPQTGAAQGATPVAATPALPTRSALAPDTPTSMPTQPALARATKPSGNVQLPPNSDALLNQAFDLVNQSRVDASLQPVEWDPAAAQLAQAHAEDMLAGGFFSHWNRDGYGPDLRAALVAGMTDAVFENIHTYWLRFDDGTPAPIEDWPQRVLDAHEGFMDSPGHRDNILDPAHTHVGIGIAYRPDTGELRLVQEFVNRYVELDPLPKELSIGDQTTITGRLIGDATDPLVNLAYEPFPQPLSVDQLNRTSTYQSASEFFSAPRSRFDGHAFEAQAIFDANRAPGLYHVRIFVTVDDSEVLAASPVVVVQ